MKQKNFFLAAMILFSLSLFAERETFNMNPAWKFHLGNLPGAEKVELEDYSWDLVSVPHTLRVFPADLSTFNKYGRTVGWYRKTINIPQKFIGKKLHLEFQGAMQTTKLFVNGNLVGDYSVSGYDSFNFDITNFVKQGKNLIAVMVDNRVNKLIPPDGITHDFVLFGGLYRDVNLVVTGDVRIPFNWERENAGVRITYPSINQNSATVLVQTTVDNESAIDKLILLETTIELKKGGVIEKIVTSQKIEAQASFMYNQKIEVKNPKLWTPDTPNLYIVKSKVIDGDSVKDSISTQIGLRWVEWNKEKGFFLNGKHLKLVGTNRHQNWPYIGAAVSNANHYADAQQLKDLGINWIRLSHYPHDPDFLTAMDEIGLMALEEGPTWMRRGPAQWMDNLEKSFTSMIRRDRNHPSIIIWNACINHERKADPRLLAAGKKEDPTRAFGQEDVYCPMDFTHGVVSGNNALTLEHTGHTYPTSRGEHDREIEQARRHQEMYRISLDTPGNHGMASWCGYDYNSFYNSKENAARHGIFDLFRLPKLSVYWHKAELTEKPMIHVVKSGSTVTVYSNCDKVKLLGGESKKSLAEISTQTKGVDGQLVSPPFKFSVSNSLNFFKAEGYKNGRVVATGIWSSVQTPVALRLHTDRDEIVADGSDVARVVVEVIDENGEIVRDSEAIVNFAIKEGHGQLIGENPIKVIDGQHIILVQAGFDDDDIEVVASSYMLKSAEIDIDVDDLKGNVIYPIDFIAKEPSKLGYNVKNKSTKKIKREVVEQFSFNQVLDATPGEWVESDVVLVGGITTFKNISIKGGEYRIYVSPYTDKKGKVGGGDAVFVRVKAGLKSGEKKVATVTIDDKKADFIVVTK